MHVSARSDYAVRALVELAAAGPRPLNREHLGTAQQIPIKFLGNILQQLKTAGLVYTHLGSEGGYCLARPAADISLADVIRAIDGPLANVHDTSLAALAYPGPAEQLREVWMAVRTSLRSVLEVVSLADLARGELPARVQALAKEYEADVRTYQG